MGQEIDTSHFKRRDFLLFEAQLQTENALLQAWFTKQQFSQKTAIGGAEVEAWLIDATGAPYPANERYLNALNHPLLVPELAQFNIEINVHPQPLLGRGLHAIEESLLSLMQHCQQVARDINAELITIGILPTLCNHHLTLSNMSTLKRYHALNEQVMRTRKGQPIQLDISGRQHLHSQHCDVMLEAATTSLQVHLQVTQNEALRYYNASLIASAATTAVGANSPFLFGKDLWDETRIPVFEQSVQVGGVGGAQFGPIKRVTFGMDFMRRDFLELFIENSEHYPVLLPKNEDCEEHEMAHVRMHNGTIWRWNRPLIGFDEDGTPHLRIEHRCISAGPTVIDQVANAAFYYGLSTALAKQQNIPEQAIDFSTVRDNFYLAARHGLNASNQWLDGRSYKLNTLILNTLIPMAEEGLKQLGMDDSDSRRYLDVIKGRTRTQQNGAQWQRLYVKQHGHDMAALTLAYLKRQKTEQPVHTWTI